MKIIETIQKGNIVIDVLDNNDLYVSSNPNDMMSFARSFFSLREFGMISPLTLTPSLKWHIDMNRMLFNAIPVMSDDLDYFDAINAILAHVGYMDALKRRERSGFTKVAPNEPAISEAMGSFKQEIDALSEYYAESNTFPFVFKSKRKVTVIGCFGANEARKAINLSEHSLSDAHSDLKHALIVGASLDGRLSAIEALVKFAIISKGSWDLGVITCHVQDEKVTVERDGVEVALFRETHQDLHPFVVFATGLLCAYRNEYPSNFLQLPIKDL